MESPENPESNDNSPSVGSQTKAAYRQANSHLDTRNIDLNQLTPETLFEVNYCKFPNAYWDTTRSHATLSPSLTNSELRKILRFF